MAITSFTSHTFQTTTLQTHSRHSTGINQYAKIIRRVKSPPNLNHSTPSHPLTPFKHPLLCTAASSDTLHPPTAAQSTAGEPSVGASHADCDTIAAVVTGTQGAVSIIRLSGDDALQIASQMFTPPGSTPWTPESHRVYYGHAVDPASGERIDEVLALVMKAPRSYTAEDVVEIHTHGGGLCAQRVLRSCITAGARLAQPGEFTLRAFLNGRLDLSQAESVAQLIDARTVAAADSALAGLSGALSTEVQAMRMACLALLAELEARLDFDEDLPAMEVEGLMEKVQRLNARIQSALATARHGQLLRTGLQVAIVGRPNVGKSSLLNALSGLDRAIVTSIAGTTRDVVEAGIVIGGIPVTLLDTAGLRESTDQVEMIGVERSMAVARQADVVLMVVDAEVGWKGEDDQIYKDVFIYRRSTRDKSGSFSSSSVDEQENEVYSSGEDGSLKQKVPSLLILNKMDLDSVNSSISSSSSSNGNGASGSNSDKCGVPRGIAGAFSAVVSTSAVTGQGLGDLKEALLKLAGAPELAPGGVAWAVNERQAEALTRAAESLQRVEESVNSGLPIDFWTIDLRSGLLALGEVSGDDVTEEVLDAVFSTFCIGK